MANATKLIFTVEVYDWEHRKGPELNALIQKIKDQIRNLALPVDSFVEFDEPVHKETIEFDY